MSNMQVFYKKIRSTKPETANAYLSALVKLTFIKASQMKSAVSDLWWSDWGSPSSEPAQN